MKGKRSTDEQIAYALRQAEAGTPVADVCRQLGVSEASFYLWKKKYAKLGLTEIRELRQLRDENEGQPSRAYQAGISDRSEALRVGVQTQRDRVTLREAQAAARSTSATLLRLDLAVDLEPQERP